MNPLIVRIFTLFLCLGTVPCQGIEQPTDSQKQELEDGTTPGNSNSDPEDNNVKAEGTVQRDQIIHSDVLRRDMLYSVYLPAGYTESKQYPVLYLLHGNS